MAEIRDRGGQGEGSDEAGRRQRGGRQSNSSSSRLQELSQRGKRFARGLSVRGRAVEVIGRRREGAHVTAVRYYRQMASDDGAVRPYT
jgi:hypothetical protein